MELTGIQIFVGVLLILLLIGCSITGSWLMTSTSMKKQIKPCNSCCTTCPVQKPCTQTICPVPTDCVAAVQLRQTKDKENYENQIAAITAKFKENITSAATKATAEQQAAVIAAKNSVQSVCDNTIALNNSKSQTALTKCESEYTVENVLNSDIKQHNNAYFLQNVHVNNSDEADAICKVAGYSGALRQDQFNITDTETPGDSWWNKYGLVMENSWGYVDENNIWTSANVARALNPVCNK
jgi:hypothetical protein